MRRMECAKCGASMEKGFVIDFAHAGSFQQRWHPGDAEKGLKIFGFKIETSTLNLTKDDAEKLLDVTTWRCTHCGFLEHYAVPGKQ